MGHSNIQTTTRYIVNYDPAHTNAVDLMASRIMPIVLKARAESGPAPTCKRMGKAS